MVGAYPEYPVKLLKAEDVAKILLCSKAQIYKLVATHAIRAYRFNSMVRIRQEDVDEYLEKSRIDQAG